ncbi:MAG: hypothetical protein Kow0068_01730 [Marinilabiliales bacterium]
MRLAEYLPILYDGLLPDFFYLDIEKEKIADCKNCIMLKPEKTEPELQYFSEQTKCCTYFPVIPNYLAGYILKEMNNTEGFKLLKKIIDNNSGVTPKNISPPKPYKLLYNKGKKDFFGKAESMKCPFYDNISGFCSIWDARTAVCSTFFCRYNYGYFGERFWLFVQEYLIKTEDILSDYALYKSGIISETIINDNNDELLAEDIDNKPTIKEINQWKNIKMSKYDFYIQTYQIIKSLTKEDFKRMMGFTSDYLIEKIKNAYNNFKQIELPEFLKFNSENSIYPAQDNNINITTSAGVFNINPTVLQVLLKFNGQKSTNDIIKELEEQDIIIEKDLLFNFYFNRILI